MRLLSTLTLVSLMLVACAAPSPGSDPAKPESMAVAPTAATSPGTPVTGEVPAAIKQRTKPAPPMSDPLRAERVPDEASAPTGPPGMVDTSCKTDADCSVKNVGNCCGNFPACVNVNSPTDPKGVQAQCAKDGMASVCGFAEISSCQCVQGQCQADTAAAVR